MRITRSVTLAVTTGTLLLGLMAPAMSATEQAGQCSGSGIEIQASEQGSTETVDVDGTMVTVTISDQTVSFSDDAGQPIEVTFCVKSSDDNSGTQTGSSWTVQLENGGGQAPAISHVIVYALAGGSVVDDDIDTDDDIATDTDTDTDDDTDTDTDTDDAIDTDDDTGVLADDLARGTVVPPEGDTSGLAYDLTRDDAAPGTPEDTDVTVAAAGAADDADAGSDELAATGLPVLVLLLLGLGALISGTGAISATRRR